jgi:DNA-binding CsgD family transcriptional regulator
VIIDVDDYIAHYGTPRHSGRYPWGSGDDDRGQRNKNFLNYVAGLRKQGLSETDIARGLGITTTQLRAAKTIAKNAQNQADIAMAQRLRDKGLSNVAIGERMGKPESSIRALLAPGRKERVDILETTSNMLKDQVENKNYIDIGAGVEYHVGVSRTRFNTAVAMLQEQGYKVHYVKVEQLGTGKQTTVKVLSKPDVPYSEVYRNRDKIQQITDFSEDHGRSYLGLKTPLSVSSKRVAVRYANEGGKDADGVIYVRPGVSDISLGNARYAQVRIAVDGTHYLKGMAMYKDDLPDGVDLMFNTNKNNTGNKLDALKTLKDDPDNPFGAVVRQLIDPETDNVISAMNIVNEEGSWERWSRNLPSQMLSKQSPILAKTQLNMTFERKRDELDEIEHLTNPAVKKKLLESFSDDADSSAVHLKAAAMRNQKSHVILPIASMKETEVYAPNYDNGTRVALVRFPHGGTFEIPELTVNNRQPEAKKLLGMAPDAIGIHSKVAERLSGADFDGDTVLVIPNDHGRIKSSPPLEGLKGFDPQSAYPPYDGMRTMDGGTWNAAKRKVEFKPGQLPSSRTKQFEMGVVSNLITDMTIQKANNAELARAVRHSMVVIDAEKHSLNYKQSEIDNNIKQLKEKYQKSKRGGASTLISRATAEERVPNRTPRPAKDGGPIDKATGKKVYVPTGETYVNKHGKTVLNTFRSTKLAETDDAHTLSSGTPIERIYADHSNRLKDLANQARKTMVNTKTTPYSPSAKIAYSNEVATLNAKLNLALRNAPLERQAQILANATVRAKLRANPDMDPPEIKKIKSQALQEMRNRTGAEKQAIEITPEEWNAIQAGAISNDKLEKILDHANLDIVKKLATPKTPLKMTDAKKSRATAMLASGYTQAEVAEALGMSVTTLKKGLSDG